MKFSLTQLQNQPLNVRIRVMWTATVIVGVVVLVLWVISTSQTIKDLDVNSTTDNGQPQAISQNKYLRAEWVEHRDGKLKIYFKVNNNTQSILNFSKLEDIKLAAKDSSMDAESVTDRQGNPFAQKVLSNSTKFGIVTFKDTDEKGLTLKFSNLFFEGQDQTIFTEQQELDLKALENAPELKS